jgi:hypothetical protein
LKSRSPQGIVEVKKKPKVVVEKEDSWWDSFTDWVEDKVDDLADVFGIDDTEEEVSNNEL